MTREQRDHAASDEVTKPPYKPPSPDDQLDVLDPIQEALADALADIIVNELRREMGTTTTTVDSNDVYPTAQLLSRERR